MTATTKRATATALPKAKPSADTVASNAPDPKSALSEDYSELLVAQAVADTRLAMADAKRKKEADKAAADAAQIETDKRIQASRLFSGAYHAWLIAKAGLEEPADLTDEEQSERFSAESHAERRLFTTPSVYPDQFWQKLEAFDAVLSDELTSGQRRDSVLLLALGSIKQDIINLDLLEVA
jgi:hypothetical protein